MLYKARLEELKTVTGTAFRPREKEAIHVPKVASLCNQSDCHKFKMYKSDVTMNDLLYHWNAYDLFILTKYHCTDFEACMALGRD